MENLFELDRASGTRKGVTDVRTFAADGGFEAPRNSLDVPFSGLLEARRNSEVRCEEIPIGYELSRSLTTRRTKEEYSNFKPVKPASEQGFSKVKGNVVSTNVILDGKPQPRAPSVVARLMGLDALPRQEMSQGSHHSSLRKVSQESIPSYDIQVNASSRSADCDALVEDDGKVQVGYGEFSFRKHPQEQQLQEFKREFEAHQALQGRASVSQLNIESLTLPQIKEQNSLLSSQMDSEEFLDALDFLNANKDFFIKILNDPHSSFAKHLQQGGGLLPSIENGTRQLAGERLTKRSFDCDVQSTGVSVEWKKRQDMHQSGPVDKARATGNLRWGYDDEMPRQVRWSSKGGSTMRNGRRVGANHPVPTRIVVLKPNLGQQPNEKHLSASSPLLRPDGILKFRMEGKDTVKHDIKLKANFKTDSSGLAREFLGGDLKDGPYDARSIAKQIVKHVKEDMSQRSSKDGVRILDLSGRKLPVQRADASSVDASGTLDGEFLQRVTKETGKFSASLPSSPRVSKVDRETELRQSSFNGRRGSYLEETKKGSYRQPLSAAKGFKESSKVDENIVQGNQGLSKKENIGKESKLAKKTLRSKSLKVRDSKCEVPRVLPRSLSAPAAPCVENRALENDSRGGHSIERATCSSRAKSSENSVFRERLLSLKDSFSLSKKRGGRKLSGPAQCSFPVDSLEPSTLRQLDAEPSDYIEVSNLLARFPWQAPPSALIENGKDVAEKSLSEMLSESSMTTSELPQWTSSTDLADSSSDTSLDKCEQPSPVSVLEMPFQEESPTSVDMRENEFKCHDFKGGLPDLETDCKEQSRNLHGAFFLQSSSRQSSFEPLLDESVDTWNLLEAQLELVGLSDVARPSGSEEEFTYIMHVLSLSGLIVNGLVMAPSLFSEHGINQSIFGRLEAYYSNRLSKGVSLVKDGGQSSLNSCSRRLLFDVVDEVVTSALKKCLLQPWTMACNQRVLVCTGKQLVERIFARTSYHRFLPSGVEEEALEDMALKELIKETPWVHSQCDLESVVLELERLLCGDVIRELFHDLRR
ncbi:hypothetical protein L7F22_061774 [Adiantum nelumboides]|nr:hypothetical protein [Adiantum nelumboides]